MLDKQDSTDCCGNPKRTDNVRTKAVTMGQVKDDTMILGGELKFQKKAAFMAERVKYWDELFVKQVEIYDGKYIKTRSNILMLIYDEIQGFLRKIYLLQCRMALLRKV